jgi:hypothetical protein
MTFVVEGDAIPPHICDTTISKIGHRFFKPGTLEPVAPARRASNKKDNVRKMQYRQSSDLIEVEEFHVLKVREYSKRKCNRALRHYATLRVVDGPTFSLGRDSRTARQNLEGAMNYFKNTILKIHVRQK